MLAEWSSIGAGTCVAGRACVIDAAEGHLLAQADRYMVLETCGVQALSGVPGWPQHGRSLEHNSFGADAKVRPTEPSQPKSANEGGKELQRHVMVTRLVKIVQLTRSACT